MSIRYFVQTAHLIEGTLVQGLPSPPNKLLYRLSIPNFRTIVGGYYPMKLVNLPIVQRTWGLLEYEARWDPSGTPKLREALATNKSRYGPSFKYDEFLEMSSAFKVVLFTIGMTLTFACSMVPPVRTHYYYLLFSSSSHVASMDSSKVSPSLGTRSVRRVEYLTYTTYVNQPSLNPLAQDFAKWLDSDN